MVGWAKKIHFRIEQFATLMEIKAPPSVSKIKLFYPQWVPKNIFRAFTRENLWIGWQKIPRCKNWDAKYKKWILQLLVHQNLELLGNLGHQKNLTLKVEIGLKFSALSRELGMAV